MFRKPRFQEIIDLAKISWRIWLVVGLAGSLLFWLGILWINFQEPFGAIAFGTGIFGGVLPIGRFWGSIKSKNISIVSITILFLIGAVITIGFSYLFEPIGVLAYLLMGGAQ